MALHILAAQLILSQTLAKVVRCLSCLVRGSPELQCEFESFDGAAHLARMVARVDDDTVSIKACFFLRYFLRAADPDDCLLLLLLHAAHTMTAAQCPCLPR